MLRTSKGVASSKALSTSELGRWQYQQPNGQPQKQVAGAPIRSRACRWWGVGAQSPRRDMKGSGPGAKTVRYCCQ